MLTQHAVEEVPGRVFEHRRLWLMRQDAFVGAADLLAAHEAAHRPQVVVGVARGGLPLAAHLGRRLGVPRVEVLARHNTSDTAYLQATGQVDLHTDAVGLVPAGARVLVVDDICGTGATLAAVTTLLAERCAPALLRTAVLCRNAASDRWGCLPDCWVWRLRDWVIFPWEPPPRDREEPTEALAVPDRLSVKEPS